MLHRESRQDSTQNFYQIINSVSFLKHVLGFFLMALFLQSCHDNVLNPYKNLDLNSLEELKSSSYSLNSREIRSYLKTMIKEDRDSMIPDYRTRGYYLNDGTFLWIDRHGLDARSDTLMNYLSSVEKMGFSKKKFMIPQIEKDLKCIRELDLVNDGDTIDINQVMARLEYNLTKAYLRYSGGQRYGFVNPTYLLNRIDEKEPVNKGENDTTDYEILFDIPIEHASNSFYYKALSKVSNDSVSEFLQDVQPKDILYKRLITCLQDENIRFDQRKKYVCNLERCRWRIKNFKEFPNKYVMVNIPAFQLYAHDGKNVLPMRVVCGKYNTKTPLLCSSIKRMDINPQWIIPKSIVEKEVIRHAGNKQWFDNHHYYIRNRKTGKRIEPYKVSWGMLKSGDYMVVQEGGNGNSLGRIIFRFDNKFSVFLHDTSSPGVFGRDNRGASHGCVRVQKPFDLAVFMLKNKDKSIIEKIGYSMTADVSKRHVEPYIDPETGEIVEVKDTLDKKKLIGSLDVSPEVPVYIQYYTVFPDENNELREYKDVYGYDQVISRHLNNYMD